MAKRTGEWVELRHFSFRMPADLFGDLEQVAKSRGIDVSGMLNWILSEYRPTLLKEKARRDAAMLDAVASRTWEKMGSPSEALRYLRDLLAQLQDEYVALSNRILGEARRAG